MAGTVVSPHKSHKGLRCCKGEHVGNENPRDKPVAQASLLRVPTVPLVLNNPQSKWHTNYGCQGRTGPEEYVKMKNLILAWVQIFIVYTTSVKDIFTEIEIMDLE